MIGARCEMPVQPVSRMLAGSFGSPAKVTLVGQAHWQVTLQVNPALVFESFWHEVGAPPPVSQSSPGSTTPLPHAAGVDVAVGVGVTVRVAVGVCVASRSGSPVAPSP